MYNDKRQASKGTIGSRSVTLLFPPVSFVVQCSVTLVFPPVSFVVHCSVPLLFPPVSFVVQCVSLSMYTLCCIEIVTYRHSL